MSKIEPVQLVNPIFVFGSNENGIHGAGAAAYACKHFGAKWGQGKGLHGRSYALPTKGYSPGPWKHGIGTTLPLEIIEQYIWAFIACARQKPDRQFQVTCIGCGLAGLKHADIAPMFNIAPMDNCFFDLKWQPWLPETAQYWGTHD